MESDSNKNFEFKVMHKLNFRCVTCRKVYASEEGVKKHIRLSHGILTPTSIHYTSFVGEKRIKVPIQGDPSRMVNPEVSQNPGIETNQSSMSVSSVSYNCAMCEKVFQSYDGVKGHLKSFHGITRPMNHDMFSYNFSPNPMLKTSQQPSNFVAQLVENNKSETSHTMAATAATEEKVSDNVDEKNQNKLKQCLKKKHKTVDKSKGKAKNKIDFCSSLSNIFTKGSVKMESLNLWGKKKPKLAEDSQRKNNNSQYKNNNSTKLNHLLQNTNTEPQDINHPQQNANSGPKDINHPQQNTNPGLQDINPSQENTTCGPQDINPPQRNTTPGQQDINPPSQNTTTEPTDNNPNHDTQAQDSSSQQQYTLSLEPQNIIPQLQSQYTNQTTENSDSLDPQVRTHNPPDSQRRLGVGDGNRPKIQRRKKTCDYAECEPCYVLIDCMECRFCVKRNLK